MILMDIFNSKYAYKDKLPSFTQLCEKYHVGRNTVRTAIHLLEQDGYVTCEKGTNAKVAFDFENLEHNKKYRDRVASKVDSVKDVYDTLQIIMPCIAVYAIHKASDEQIHSLIIRVEDFQKNDEITCEHELQEVLMDIYGTLLGFLENESLVDLFFTMMHFVYSPMTSKSRQSDTFSKSIQFAKKMIAVILRFILSGNDLMVKKTIEVLCGGFNRVSNTYLKRITKHDKTDKVIAFAWVSVRSQGYQYNRMVDGIIKDMDQGIYTNHQLLPSMQELSIKYNTSLRTARKAIQVLKDFKVIETKNGVGSIITFEKLEDKKSIFQNKTFLMNIKKYCDSVEIMYFICDAYLKTTLKKISEDEFQKMCSAFENLTYFHMEPLIIYMTSKSNDCMKTIIKELQRNILWVQFLKLILDYSLITFDEDAFKAEFMEALHQRDFKKVTEFCCIYLKYKYEIANKNISTYENA